MKVYVVLLCPIIEEYAETRKFLKKPKQYLGKYSGLPYEVDIVKSRNARIGVAIREAGRDNQNIIKAVTQAEKDFKPKYIFLVGTAGGIHKVKLGDIIIADIAYNYESGREKDSGFVPNPVLAEASSILLQQAKSLIYKEDFSARYDLPAAVKIVAKPIASGSKVIESLDGGTFNMIRNTYSDVRAIEMEAYGFYHIAQTYPAIQFLNIRSISDSLSDKRAANEKGSKELAARHAAIFTFALIKQLEIKLELPKKAFRIALAGLSLLLLLLAFWGDFRLLFSAHSQKGEALSSEQLSTQVSPLNVAEDTTKFTHQSKTAKLEKVPSRKQASQEEALISDTQQVVEKTYDSDVLSTEKITITDRVASQPSKLEVEESNDALSSKKEAQPISLNKPKKRINCYIGVHDAFDEAVKGVSIYIDSIKEQTANNYLPITVGEHWLVLKKGNLYYEEKIFVPDHPKIELNWVVSMEEFIEFDDPSYIKKALKLK
ncbi:MAG: hypothetical protein AAF849_03215 [Bacteroidota bacterium]